MSKVVCKNCLGTGIELGVHGSQICGFCSDEIISDVMSMSDDEVSAELVANGVDPDAEVARMMAMATELRIMNERENERRKKEQHVAFIMSALLMAVTIIAWYFDFFGAINPFDGK